MRIDQYSFFRILKGEYVRTNNKVIGKSRFPSLLSDLWKTDVDKTKTNLVKSFMKAGVFPFNPNSIDRSRILKTNNNIAKSSSSISTTMPTVNPDNSSSEGGDISPINTNHRITSDQLSMPNNTFSKSSKSGFSSSHEAISALDQILQQTVSNDNDDDDEDPDFLPNDDHNLSPIDVSSSIKHNSRVKQSTNTMSSSEVHPSQQQGKRKKGSTRLISFDTSDEDGTLSLAQLTSSKGIPVLDEPTNDMQSTSSKIRQSTSIAAITTTLETMFGQSIREPSAKPTKRTVVKRSIGQIMTEEDVIAQMEENEKKRPKRTYRKSNGKK